MIGFSNTTMLWLLGGLAVPIAIHLLSRKEGTLIRIGSVRHLEETPTSKFKSFKLNEVLLLALRSLLIALIVLLLSGIVLNNRNSSTSEKWVLIESDMDENPVVMSAVDSLLSDGYELHYFTSEFPTEKDEQLPDLDYRRLLRELQKERVHAIILSHGYSKYFNGSITSLPDHIQWINVTTDGYSEMVRSTRVEEHVWTRRGLFTDSLTSFTNETSNGGNVETTIDPDSITVELYVADGFENDKRLLMAAIRSIQTQTPDRLHIRELDDLQAKDSDNLFINLSDTILRDYRVINYKPGLSNGLIERMGRNKWELKARLNQENILDHNFAAHLMEIILDDPILESKVRKNDIRAFEKEIVFASVKNADNHLVKSESQANVHVIITILMLITLVIERSIAFKRSL